MAVRKYKDPEGIFYPPDINPLIIVEKLTDDHELWFPFELTLEWQLRVNIHSIWDRVVWCFMGKPHQHDGWCFQIKGQYPTVAQAALEDAKQTDKRPSIISLHAAVKGWMDTQTTDLVYGEML
jgi:hypothetical protein